MKVTPTSGSSPCTSTGTRKLRDQETERVHGSLPNPGSSTSIYAEPRLASGTSDHGCAIFGPKSLHLCSTARQGLADSSLC